MRKKSLKLGVFFLVASWIMLGLFSTVGYSQLVGIASPSLGDEAQTVIQQGAIDACKKYGFEYVTTNAERDALTQVNQIDLLISRGVDVVIWFP